MAQDENEDENHSNPPPQQPGTRRGPSQPPHPSPLRTLPHHAQRETLQAPRHFTSRTTRSQPDGPQL
ncbi:hypothetical protein BO78DRAFT_392582 [Aspergillus sclerotiicarbonarius CBS 121057]|uniref:Uncharacterized protein n=1 Tax=Aspergillus sclerotiicarbonarius (strain CBS 121057 / IBT 28362) TaxID=1448318 RepID=A0A319ENN5_ASPSB|nr:hypothetical protein BO78DRAFT_392582 [Aspergillus sclerotiicarbonarius CBS 121057]